MGLKGLLSQCEKGLSGVTRRGVPAEPTFCTAVENSFLSWRREYEIKAERLRRFAGTVRYLHLQSGEVASWIVQVAGWEISHSQFGYQPFLSAQDSPDCDVLKLQQVQSYLRDSTEERHQ